MMNEGLHISIYLKILEMFVFLVRLPQKSLFLTV